MATSFAAYASQFLNRQTGTASMSTSQPMFFSFSTENGSRAGNNPDTDLDDFDDPHLRSSGMSRAEHARDDDEDPYLRLDEDEHFGRAGHDPRSHNSQSIPLISSDYGGSESPGSPKGWLAHQASPLRPRSPSPTPSNSTDSGPPPDLLVPNVAQTRAPPPPPLAQQVPLSLSLTESLLPRDGRSRPLDVFSLPDPRHTPRGRRKYHDSIWTAVWLAGVSFCLFFSILLLFLTRKPKKAPTAPLPYTTLLHTVPMLTILTFLSALVAYTHIFLLRIFARPVMIATSLFIPATLFISAIWAFIGSFMWDGDNEPTWGETTGLRLFSIIPLVLSIITARRLVNLPQAIHTTSSTLNLTTQLLIANPFLLALSPAILLITLIASIPFLTLIFRLLLIGYLSHPYPGSPAWEWHVRGWANWAIAATVAVWLWSWGVARGILRMTCASVIGAWYFANPDALPPPPMSTHTIHAALTRSTGPSLGTTVLSALILTTVRLLTLLTLFLHRLPLYIPARAFFLVTGIKMAIGYLENATTALSKYALIYVGLVGDPFMPSAKRARALTASVEVKAGRLRSKAFSAEPPLTLLTVAPLTLTFPFALTTYLFVAHTLNAPEQALGAAILAGGVTALVGLFCVGLVKDAADTLYICYCIDKDMGERRREEVFATFEYGSQPQSRGRQQPATPSRRAQSPRGLNPSNSGPKGAPSRADQAYRKGEIYPEPRQPRQQLVASTSTLQQTQRMPLPPPPPAPVVEEVDEDLDPFEQSYLEDNPQLLPAARPLSPPFSEQQQQQSSPPPRMQTSRELNMKSPIPYSVGPGTPDDDSDLEAGSSQFFPGSGLFQ
ncbi:plasma-membrane choline transporter-domain-containing protein [Infundibulicybe gibba]|nr:plasma-membrane choline transporter-domain-containing protein [Infundibulicybe gibba]